MVGLVYIAVPYLILWFIFDLVFGRIRGRTLIFFAIITPIVYIICFILGMCLNFWFEPDSYWHSMTFDTTYWDTHSFPPGATLAHCLLIPYIALVTLFRASGYILSTHFSWSFAVSYALGIFIMINYISAAISARRIRNPNYGFGDTTEYNKILDEYKKRST